MLGLIGGTGLCQLAGLDINEQRWVETPYGDPSAALSFGDLVGRPVVFIARHGDPHRIAPHQINYRANLCALKQVGVTDIVAVNAVGGIHPDLGPSQIAIPDQIIDYTYGREHSIYDGVLSENLDHIDFTYPYNQVLRAALIQAADSIPLNILKSGVYGATQGPRLESAAEIQRLKRDGCDLVGMTGMPEASLAKELGMNYACIALSVNWAAGLGDSIITMDDIHQALDLGMEKIHQILQAFIAHSNTL